MVIQELNQSAGIDYNQTFSLVARMDTIRVFLSIVAWEELQLAQVDGSTVFVYGKLDEEIYMKQSPFC